jgi:hypothetical protein
VEDYLSEEILKENIEENVPYTMSITKDGTITLDKKEG